MAKASSPVPAGFHSLTPYLILDHVDRFLEFVGAGLNATEKFLMRDGQGVIRHGELQLAGSILEFAQANPDWPAMPGGLHFYVKDVDAAYGQAIRAGATSLYPPASRDYGDREAGIRDVSGNIWFLATHTAGDSHIPQNLRDLNTYFAVKDASAFVAFLEALFNTTAVQKDAAQDGNILHAKVQIGDTVVEVGEGRPPYGPRAVAHHHYSTDCDAVFARGLAAGCRQIQPMRDEFYGDRAGSLLDAWGNHWYIATHLEDLTSEEIAERAAAAGRG